MTSALTNSKEHGLARELPRITSCVGSFAICDQFGQRTVRISGGSRLTTTSDTSTPLCTKTNIVHQIPAPGIPILLFNAFVAEARHFTVEMSTDVATEDKYSGKTEPISWIIDQYGYRCGSLFDLKSSNWPMERWDEFVLLSRYRISDAAGRYFDPAGYDESLYPAMVLLITWQRGYAERLALGQMHINAFRKVSPKEKLIQLA